MIDSSPTVRIFGIKDPTAVEAYFCSSLVDVACIADFSADSANVLLEDVDARNPRDREWVANVLAVALSECGEAQATIEFIVAPQP